MPELYDHVLSDRCYTVRLLLALLGIEYRKRTVDYAPSRSPRSREVLPLSPTGEIPVFVDGDIVLDDLTAILVHICRNSDPYGRWRADDAATTHWLSFAAGPLAAISQARAVSLFGAAGDRETLVAAARTALRTVEDHLSAQTLAGLGFLTGGQPGLADIAVFPAIALSHDCGIGHEDYPAINLWQRRIRRLPGFVTMPGIPDYF